MKEHELKELKESVKAVVIETVNGKIDNIKTHLEKQDKKLEAMEQKIDELKPVAESLTAIRLIKKFILWVAPLGAIFGILKWIK